MAFIALALSLLCIFPTLSVLLSSSTDAFKEFRFTPSWLPKPLTLGLDLQGGGQLVYQVLSKEAIKSKLQSLAQSVRSDLRSEKIAVTKAASLEDNKIEVTLLSDRLIDKAKTRIGEQFKNLTFENQQIDSGRAILRYAISPTEAAEIEKGAIVQAVETLRNRIDQFGIAEPLIQRVGIDRIMLQMPGVSNLENIKDMVGKVAKLEFRLVPSAPGTASLKLKERDGSVIEVEDEVLMTGDAVSTARASLVDNKVDVSLTLTREGGQTFGRITKENVGRRLAIILDNIVYSAPMINEAITGGMASISGGFGLEEARNLAVVLRSGALPAPLKILEERTVGPTLGRESIRSGIIAIVAGFVAIVVFMVFYYRKSGVVAASSLVLNLVFLVAILALFGATLTLPGLAGLALTAGMAVDSNVIIFERIRDEINLGAQRDAAVRAGFDRALSAIMDSNLTTLLTAFILYWLGSGPIRGFAVTLAVGIVTTVFCAIFLARLAFDCFELKGNRNGLSI